MLNVGDWETMEPTDDQKLLAHELGTLAIELAENRLHLLRMNLNLLSNPTPELQDLIDDHNAKKIEPLFEQMKDPAVRLLSTAIDQSELEDVMKTALSSVKQRALQLLGRPVEQVIGALMGPLFLTLQKGDVSYVQNAAKQSFKLDFETARSFLIKNGQDLVPMLTQLGAQGVKVPILLFVADCFGLPTGQLKQQLQTIATEGLISGR